MMLDSDSLVRLVPDELASGDTTGLETLDLHLARYVFATRHARPGRLLDIACGVGYGTRLLADRSEAALSALGVDISESAIAYARERYGGGAVDYRAANAMTFEDPAGFDTIVSLETVEHLEAPEAFVARLVSMLRPEGVLVASVPTTPSVDINPHHRHDFTESSFRRLVGRHGLREIDSLRQVQRVGLGAVLHRQEARLRDVRPNLPSYYAGHPGALLRRIASTLRHGLANHYLTLTWQADG